MLYGTYYMLDAVLRTLHIQTHLIFIITLGGTIIIIPYFTEGK